MKKDDFEFSFVEDIKEDIGNLIEAAYKRGVEHGVVQGRNEAWEVAKRFRHPTYGGFNGEEQKEIFGYRNADDILTNYSASEAIAKIKGYEGKSGEKCNYCIHCEVCGWIDKFNGHGCDFYEDGVYRSCENCRHNMISAEEAPCKSCVHNIGVSENWERI